MENEKISKDELEFTIFCIESLAEFYHVDGRRMYDVLTRKSDILYNYIIPVYDPLHTQGKTYIVNELIEVINERGVQL